MKQITKIAGSLILAAAAVGLTSCGGNTGKKGETVTLQVYDQLANYSGEQIGWFGKIMEDKFNVKLNIIPESGNTYTTRMESGNLGDIVIWGADGDDYLDAVDGGYLLDWEEDDLLSEHGAYIKDHMHQALEKNREVSGTGKIYGIGHGVSTSSKDRQGFFYTWDIRFDLYQQLGKPEIKNYDDLVELFKKMKEICPTDDNGKETYALSLFPDWDGNMVMFVKSLATAYVGWDEFEFGLYDPETGIYHDCLEPNGEYIKAMRFINKLYQNNLLDPDSMTQNYDAMSEDYQNGTAFFNIFNWMGSGAYNTDAHKEAGKAMYPIRPEEAKPIVYGQSVFGSNRIWSIGSKTEYPELCMDIINWLCTPEGFMTSLYGPKGVTWDYDGNGKTYFTELGKKVQQDQKTIMPAPYSGSYQDGSFQMNNITWAQDATNPDSNGETYNKDQWASNALPAQTQIEQDWRDWADAVSVEDYLGKGKFVVAPGSAFSIGTKDEDLQMKANQMQTCIKTGTWNALYAKSDAEFDSLVAKMTEEAKGYGYADLKAWADEQAERRKAAEDAAAE